ncbi:MAG TPA: tyrosine--tRNA ligase [Oligoflexia bacterium]|nr:tyrosine--tRNA ligase [Oligoflexia bacterium]HMP49626.1 tyrosine--tRNA ligase [Oligoflexia bacterium]
MNTNQSHPKSPEETKQLSLIDELVWRGSIHDASNQELLAQFLETSSRTLYCGFDPTADSLHAGNLLPLTVFKRLINRGHKIIVLLGSATGLIGDPSGKSQERVLLDESILKNNVTALKTQIRSILGTENSDKIIFVQNGDWLSRLSFIDVLRDIGKHITVNYMIAKDSVKTRLSEREQGISYTEFSYMLLQAYDFFHLFNTEGCSIQIGGSDQWGNITAGLDYIKKVKGSKTEAFGLTLPLLTTSEGKKFGKSEAGAIWLDPSKTSAYAFYQFWLNISDEEIERYLKLFSMRSPKEILDILEEHRQAPEKRTAQKKLAEELTSSLHGENELKAVIEATNALFTLKPESLTGQILVTLQDEIPTTRLKDNSLSLPMSLQEVLVTCKASTSKTAARKLIESGGVYVNHQRVEDAGATLEEQQFLEGKAALLRTGKKHYFLILK